MSAKTKIPSHIKPEGYGKAALAYLIDFACIVVTIVLLYFTLGRTAVHSAVNYQGAIKAWDDYMLNSGLVSSKGENSWDYLDFVEEEGKEPAYRRYIDLVWEFFTVKCVDSNSGYTLEAPSMTSVGEAEFIPFEGEKTPENVGKWVYSNFFTSNLWKAPVKEGTTDPDYTKAPISAGDDTAILAKLKAAMYDTTTGTPTGSYVYTVSHLLYQPGYQAKANQRNLRYWIGWMPGFVLAPVIFLFIIPMSVRNGRTIGKIAIGTAVLGSDGYVAKKAHLALHYAFPVFFWIMLAIPVQSITFPLFMLLHLVEFMTLVMTHNHQSIHDKVASTIVIDAKKSTWFASKEDEVEYIKNHPNSYVAKLEEEKRKEEDPVRQAALAAMAAEDAIIDSSTIGSARRRAQTIDSFDEFEQTSDQEYERREEEKRSPEPAPKPKVEPEPTPEEEPIPDEEELSEEEKKELEDLAKLEGLSEEEAKQALDEEDFTH